MYEKREGRAKIYMTVMASTISTWFLSLSSFGFLGFSRRCLSKPSARLSLVEFLPARRKSGLHPALLLSFYFWQIAFSRTARFIPRPLSHPLSRTLRLVPGVPVQPKYIFRKRQSSPVPNHVAWIDRPRVSRPTNS